MAGAQYIRAMRRWSLVYAWAHNRGIPMPWVAVDEAVNRENIQTTYFKTPHTGEGCSVIDRKGYRIAIIVYLVGSGSGVSLGCRIAATLLRMFTHPHPMKVFRSTWKRLTAVSGMLCGALLLSLSACTNRAEPDAPRNFADAALTTGDDPAGLDRPGGIPSSLEESDVKCKP
jgi:hypothetical protein